MSGPADPIGYYERRRWIKDRWQINAAEWLRRRGDTIGALSGHSTWVAVDHGRDVICTWTFRPAPALIGR